MKEEYGNAPTDSSDDEDYFDMDAPQKKDDNIRRDTKSGRRNSEETGSTSRRKTRTKKDTEAEMEIDSPGPELAEKETTTPTSKALGQAGKEVYYCPHAFIIILRCTLISTEMLNCHSSEHPMRI